MSASLGTVSRMPTRAASLGERLGFALVRGVWDRVSLGRVPLQPSSLATRSESRTEPLQGMSDAMCTPGCSAASMEAQALLAVSSATDLRQ